MIGFPPKAPRPQFGGAASKAPAPAPLPPESSAPDPDVDPTLVTAEDCKRILLASPGYRLWVEHGWGPDNPPDPAILKAADLGQYWRWRLRPEL